MADNRWFVGAKHFLEAACSECHSGPALTDAEAILKTRDPLLEPVHFDQETIDELTAFMHALTDDAARDLSRLIPERVPSGLPLDRLGGRASPLWDLPTSRLGCADAALGQRLDPYSKPLNAVGAQADTDYTQLDEALKDALVMGRPIAEAFEHSIFIPIGDIQCQ